MPYCPSQTCCTYVAVIRLAHCSARTSRCRKDVRCLSYKRCSAARTTAVGNGCDEGGQCWANVLVINDRHGAMVELSLSNSRTSGGPCCSMCAIPLLTRLRQYAWTRGHPHSRVIIRCDVRRGNCSPCLKNLDTMTCNLLSKICMEGRRSGPHTSMPYNALAMIVLMHTVRRSVMWCTWETDEKDRARCAMAQALSKRCCIIADDEQLVSILSPR